MNIRGCVVSIAAAAAVGVSSHHAAAQVAESNWPISQLSVDLAPSSPVWQGWSLFGMGYGGGNNGQGGSGMIGHAYDFAFNLQAIVVTMPELRNSWTPFSNDVYVRNHGQVDFTPLVALPYALTGQVPMTLVGTSASSTLCRGTLVLEEIGGPALATFGTVLARAGGGVVNGNLFDVSSPIAGSANGMLAAGITYRLSWDFLVTGELNGDQTFSADITSNSSSFFQISFVPTPGAAALAALAALSAARRRRC